MGGRRSSGREEGRKGEQSGRRDDRRDRNDDDDKPRFVVNKNPRVTKSSWADQAEENSEKGGRGSRTCATSRENGTQRDIKTYFERNKADETSHNKQYKTNYKTNYNTTSDSSDYEGPSLSDLTKQLEAAVGAYINWVPDLLVAIGDIYGKYWKDRVAEDIKLLIKTAKETDDRVALPTYLSYDKVPKEAVKAFNRMAREVSVASMTTTHVAKLKSQLQSSRMFQLSKK